MAENECVSDRKKYGRQGLPASHSPSQVEPGKRPTLTLDVAFYESYLEDGDLSEEQKRELLEALWSIIVSFVDLGFGIHPLQQTNDDGGQNGIPAEFLIPDSGDDRNCHAAPQPRFDSAKEVPNEESSRGFLDRKEAQDDI